MSEPQGTGFLYRRREAPSPKAAVLLVHGLGAHTARWDFLAGHLASRGYASYALDLRGFGRTSERPRGHVDSFRVWDRDVLALRELVGRELPGRKVFLLGESLGSLLAFNLAARTPAPWAGAVLISPSFGNGMKFPLSSYVKLVTHYPFKPTATIPVPFTSAMCTRDEAYRAVMDAHPDEVRAASIKLLMATLGEQRAAKRLAKTLAVPVLFLVAGKDHLVDPRAERAVFARLTVPDRTIREYPEMFHALSIDRGREAVFADIVAWLDARA